MSAVHHPVAFLSGQWSDCTSSNVLAAMYDPATEQLHIRFKSGGGGHYSGVSESVAAAFAEAPSAGTFVYYTLRGGRPKGAGYPWVPG